MESRIRHLTTIGLFLLLAATGCARQDDPPPIGYWLSSSQDASRLRRILFVEVGDASRSPEVARGMTREITQAIQAQKLFHVTVISRDDPACRDLPLDIRGPYDLRQILAIRKGLECDAVLFGTLTSSQSYPRMQVGLYMRLIDLRNGKLIWAVDHTWDSTDKVTEQRLRKFFEKQMRGDYDPVQWRLGLVSPRVFQKFVAGEIAGSIRR